MPKRPRFNTYEVDTMARHYLNGMGLRKIAELMGSCVPTVRCYIAKRVPIRPRGRPKIKKLLDLPLPPLPDKGGDSDNIQPGPKRIADFPTDF